MAHQTIVVIDADPTLERKITATLEATGYTVFTGPGSVVTADVLRSLAPSLIYIKPLAPSRAGFEPCKTIHGNPVLKSIPIVLLASLKGSLDSRYFTIYGIVDALKPSFTPDELIEMTETILGNIRPSWMHGLDEVIAEKSAISPNESGTGIAEENQTPPREGSMEAIGLQEEDPSGLSWLRKGEKEDRREKSARTAPWSQAAGGKGKKRPPFILAAAGAAILLVIVGAVIWLYQPSTTSRKVTLSPAVAPPPPAPSKAPEVRPEPQLPPAKKTPDTPAPSTPSTRPAQPVQTPPPSQDSGARPARKPVYSVQLGVFRSEDNAQTFAKDFREKGYDASIQVGVTADGSPLYRVLAGKFEDRKTAERVAEEIQSKENIKPAVRRE